MSYSARPHRRQPTRLPRPWDSPGKNTGVGCHFLLQCMKVKNEREVAQLCPTLSDPMDCSPPGSSVHGIFQARALEWVPVPSPSHALERCRTIWDACCTMRSGASLLLFQWEPKMKKTPIPCSNYTHLWNSGKKNNIHIS